MTGPIPPQLGQLIELRKLELGHNQLTGPIPPQLGQLTNLQSLDLSSTQLTTLPPELSQLQMLDYVYLSGNPLLDCLPAIWRDQDFGFWSPEPLPYCTD